MALHLEDFEQLQAPSTVDSLGIPAALVEDLFVRQLYTKKRATIAQVADLLAISHAAGDEVARSLRNKKIIEYQGAEGRDYWITLTESGTRNIIELMKNSKHVGQIPVSLRQYQTLTELQKTELHVDRKQIKEALSELVLEDQILDQIGPALAGDGAIFLYGPPGTGKTSIAQEMGKVYGDCIAIPRYVETDGHIISVYDPAIHTPIDAQPEELDKRFVLCERPILIVGGELSLSMLDLQHDGTSGISLAPIQMLANNGILVIDDFGRQAISPQEILNRWILPLAQGVDYLRSKSGSKVTIPFELKLIFSTNLEPKALGDDAFLRRMRNKIFVGSCSRRSFDWILAKESDKNGLEISQEAADTIAHITESYLGELRPYVAVDFCDLTKTVCEYDKRPLEMNEESIERVSNLYFIKDSVNNSTPTMPPPSMRQPQPRSSHDDLTDTQQERRRAYS